MITQHDLSLTMQEEEPQVSWKACLGSVFLLVLILISSFIIVYLEHSSNTLFVQLEHANQKLMRLHDNSKNFKLEQSRYLDPEFILKKARILGLRPIHPEQIVSMGDHDQLNVHAMVKDETLITFNGQIAKKRTKNAEQFGRLFSAQDHTSLNR